MAAKDHLDLKKYLKEFQEFLKEELEIVKKFVNDKDKVLDVGCGAGRAIPEISHLVSEYTGIDIDEEYLSQARNLSKEFANLKIINLDVEKLSTLFEKNKFDKS